MFLGGVAPAASHSGGLNASGCHGGSKPYHCHRTPREIVVTSDGRNRLRCDLGSRSIECTNNRPRKIKTPVLDIQIQLKRHCANLPSDFTDGIYGPLTRLTLIRFQRAYGLSIDGKYGPATARALAQRPNGRC